jgi:hypothetical protein
MNIQCSYNNRENNNLTRSFVLMLSILALVTISAAFTVVMKDAGQTQSSLSSLLVPTFQDAMAAPVLDCDDVDDDSNGDCDQDLDQSAEDFTDCNDDNIPNCIAEQTVSVHNDLNSNEEAKIDQEMTQLLDCNNNIACEQSVLNRGIQRVLVETVDLDQSTVDFDVGQTMTQTLAQGGQSNFDADNLGTQSLAINALDTSTVDADSDGSENIKMIMTQLTDECDGSPTSTCRNFGFQDYDIDTASDAFVDISTDQGLEMTQRNIDCDNGVNCRNSADQSIDIEANRGTAGSAFVDFETDDSFSDVVQINDCENTNGGVFFECINEDGGDTVEIEVGGDSYVDVDSFGQDSTQKNNCQNAGSDGCINNNGANMLDIDSFGTSIVQVSGGQDSYQENRCSEGADCENRVSSLKYQVRTSDSSTIEVDGTQDTNQKNICDDGSSCFNTASVDADIRATDSSSIDSDFSQLVSQLNQCTNGANCKNDATVLYSVSAEDGSVIKSESDQRLTQINTCSTGQNCMNVGTLTNNVFASGTAKLNADSTQILTQTCTPSSGPNCLNMNTLTTDGSATSNAVLTYATIQNVNTADPDGTASIDIDRSSGTTNLGTITQTSNGVITP